MTEPAFEGDGAPERRALPIGVVTFLFTDIEGSTRMIRTQPERYSGMLALHRVILRQAFGGGVEFGTAGDALFYAFDRADQALAAAVCGQRLLAVEKGLIGLNVRMGVSTGSVERVGEDYVGLEVHRVARICAAAHGGQIVCSGSVKDVIEDGYEFDDLGEYSLAGLGAPERLYQLVAEGLRSRFPPLRVAPAEPSRKHRFRGNTPPDLTLDEAARSVRGALPRVAPNLREPLTALSARLFTGARAIEYADRFLGRVDDARLEKRLKEHSDIAVFSEKAAQATARIQNQIDRVATVRRRRHWLAQSAAEVPELIATPNSIVPSRVGDMESRVTRRMSALDEAIIQAVMSVDPLCYKLKRTRYRGIYKDGTDYVVPYVNHLGIDALRSFDEPREAIEFRESVRENKHGEPGQLFTSIDKDRDRWT